MYKKIVFLSFLAVLWMHEQVIAQQKQFWSAVSNSALQQNSPSGRPVFIPQAYKTFKLAEDAFRQSLAAALLKGVKDNVSSRIISIPNATGKLEHFKIMEAPVMSAALGAKYPQLKAYAGQGIENPAATIRFSITPKGLHAMILSGNGKTVYINPADKQNGLYVVFDRSTNNEPKNNFTCAVQSENFTQKGTAVAKNANDNILRTYRFAVAVSGQFSKFCLDGTEVTDAEKKLSVMSTLVTDLTRINGIFERDFDIHLNYVENEDSIIFLDSKTDPFDDNTSSGYDDGKWNVQCKKTLDKYIGNSNYDCGHLLMGLNTGGNAGCIGCVCDPETKGTAVTGYPEVAGDPFVVDFWAHEIGHQFGASHTFDYEDEGNTGSQMEPGSGSTIMGYAGTTGATDVQPNSDDYFHAISIEQITNYIKNIDGLQGPTLVPTGNHTPTANAGGDYIIPVSTPFTLTGVATDADALDVLSYNWEQFDGIGTGYNQYPIATATAGAVFRSFNYAASTSRTFPVLDTVLAGKTNWKWEAIPAVGRTLNFRFTVRDNHAGGGSNNSDDMQVTVDNTAGPFVVTGLDTATEWKGGSHVTVAWNVANTNNAVIKCNSVNIQFSTDGGHTFPITLAAGTPNDGSESVQVPNIAITAGRIRVMAVGNIFFDISNANIIVTPTVVPLTWTSFTANKSSNGAMLTWTTANETSNEPFEVERSSDGVQYTVIGTVPAGAQQYQFEDVQPIVGTDYYRIKQLDAIGTYYFSAIDTVMIDKANAVVKIYPNPAANVATIRLNENAARAVISLISMSGQVVYTTTVSSITAGQAVQVPVAKLAAGIYIVQVNWDNGKFTKQLMIE